MIKACWRYAVAGICCSRWARVCAVLVPTVVMREQCLSVTSTHVVVVQGNVVKAVMGLYC